MLEMMEKEGEKEEKVLIELWSSRTSGGKLEDGEKFPLSEKRRKVKKTIEFVLLAREKSWLSNLFFQKEGEQFSGEDEA